MSLVTLVRSYCLDVRVTEQGTTTAVVVFMGPSNLTNFTNYKPSGSEVMRL